MSRKRANDMVIPVRCYITLTPGQVKDWADAHGVETSEIKANIRSYIKVILDDISPIKDGDWESLEVKLS